VPARVRRRTKQAALRLFVVRVRHRASNSFRTKRVEIDKRVRGHHQTAVIVRVAESEQKQRKWEWRRRYGE